MSNASFLVFARPSCEPEVPPCVLHRMAIFCPYTYYQTVCGSDLNYGSLVCLDPVCGLWHHRVNTGEVECDCLSLCLGKRFSEGSEPPGSYGGRQIWSIRLSSVDVSGWGDLARWRQEDMSHFSAPRFHHAKLQWGFVRGATCAVFCAVSAAEGGGRLHITRPKQERLKSQK